MIVDDAMLESAYAAFLSVLNDERAARESTRDNYMRALRAAFEVVLPVAFEEVLLAALRTNLARRRK